MARLECEIKFISLKYNNDEKFCEGLLDFEALLTSQLLISVDKLPESAKEYEDIKKAAKCIAVIRKRADEIIRQTSFVKESAYWIELLIRTLKYASYPSVDGISQLTDFKKKYALISALLLADNCLKKPEILIQQQPLIVSICSKKYEFEDSPPNEKERISSKKYSSIPAGMEKMEDQSHDNRRVIRVFIASPGDLKEERRRFRKIIDEVNRSKAYGSGIQLEPLGWEDTSPGVGRPQGLINKDIHKCDLMIMLLWKWWGTPTGEYLSGFEEEYELAKHLHVK
ncbi:MAG: DUF4062 domain-containing protein [Candidatus Heimdallarchaeota archaeon]|nr:DUF4062 domain-containing protein [Candidatus Heimdallarchaeota archaeon]